MLHTIDLRIDPEDLIGVKRNGNQRVPNIAFFMN